MAVRYTVVVAKVKRVAQFVLQANVGIEDVSRRAYSDAYFGRECPIVMHRGVYSNCGAIKVYLAEAFVS